MYKNNFFIKNKKKDNSRQFKFVIDTHVSSFVIKIFTNNNTRLV